ncbi:MAG: hypothetical protein E6K53_17015 [Gammaproteobacteria bacterium]|nr:MAG: hypothetical protein E6K53_17015 [Gammaproteobacteria bacterium]
MKRRNFLGLPLFAAGTGVFAYSKVLDAHEATGLRLTLLRLDGSDGTAADTARSDACWARAVGCGTDAEWTRIALQGFVASRGRAPKSLSVKALFAGDEGRIGATHELFRYAAATPAALSKPIGFHATRATFAGLRVSLVHNDGTERMADVSVPLVSGLYALLLDAPALPGLYAFSGDRTRPLGARFGSTPNHFVLSVAENV